MWMWDGNVCIFLILVGYIGIDGQGGMRLTCGTTAAEEKDKLARVVKVLNLC